MPSRLILTIGLPGSGKSTWAQGQAAKGLVDLVIERDIIREQLTGDRRNHTQEPLVTRAHFSQVKWSLQAGRTVVVADTNLKRRYTREWKRLAEECGAEYEEVSFMHVPVTECIRRDAERDNPVGEEVILRMWKSWCSSENGGSWK